MTKQELIEKYEKRLKFIQEDPYRGDERKSINQFITDLKQLEG